LSKVNNIQKNSSLVTREDLFAGLPFDERIESCVKMVFDKSHQFVNETSIMLDLARKGASVYVSCEAENDTDICAFLAQLDIEVEHLAKETVEKLKGFNL
jgi:hypothetical protein